MRKIKDVLRLHHAVGFGQREIARSVQLAQSTVHEYLSRSETAGLSWPLPQDCDESKLVAALFPNPVAAAGRALLSNACRYQSVQSMLQNGLDRATAREPVPAHGFAAAPA